MNANHEKVRQDLKCLLLRLAAVSDEPAAELSALLRDVLNELHGEVKDALSPRSRLRLVPSDEAGTNDTPRSDAEPTAGTSEH